MARSLFLVARGFLPVADAALVLSTTRNVVES
jgi:hypothetical protein